MSSSNGEDKDMQVVDHTKENESSTLSSHFISALKIIVSSALLVSALSNYISHRNNANDHANSSARPGIEAQHRRRLMTDEHNTGIPTYMDDLFEDLKERKKLMEETPPEEVKYWFEYTGPLQKYYYRYSKSRKKADSFEGRDDSGVVSSRFVANPGGGKEFTSFFNPEEPYPETEIADRKRLLDNCLVMGNINRPDLRGGSSWHSWFGIQPEISADDRCRILVVLNTVGAGRGPTILWETNPPSIHKDEPQPWISEQETAATHLERNLKEMDAMCASGLIAIRLQVLVCEPIPGRWTDWIDSLLPNCGGQAPPLTKSSGEDERNPYDAGIDVEERPSPVQVVVVASADTADVCHDLKSGFMEKRLQDLILAPPYLTNDSQDKVKDPTIKTTHPDLISSDDHDLYIGMKWSSLLTIRATSSFLQASADIVAAAASPMNEDPQKLESDADGTTVSLSKSPSSPFLLPSFLRVSYVSEENNKVAKWRMHGDFFHPAAWEICGDSFDMTWIPHSLSGNGGINGICYEGSSATAVKRRLEENGHECGQWWVFMAEEQMPVSPEVFANEVTSPLVLGGSNHFWMITEIQRKEIVKQKVCEHLTTDKEDIEKCGQEPQAVMPLGDLQSFLINFTPNTALGKRHNTGRTPGYSRKEERDRDREIARERKQLKGQTDIEKALFDYTVYPSALFHKDATIKAARSRDKVLTKKEKHKENIVGPQTVKSSYYDVTITKPREPISAWCQAISRKGLCSLYAQYFREFSDLRCLEACGMSKNWSKI
mmetsp:Transcript_2471/g.3476  ORF Transcript_2471/g.3476 Transcript_2471/m.3476 type:complete len:774 (+) Transcript_2471:60-2381(+)|eukprot:CAMPEP_0184864810 /NCGR_PEP_ID=MMETSP0580-20130426/16099_1 /TAXON_ID=1118495 /ORGANISM="Dactyliosolen fragilissimus" /LENGTH=773 /DNA_ID=CAMNT_0027363729 /DNA_START=27 /DNA_END=2348 /DNA_ORIENTATION=-